MTNKLFFILLAVIVISIIGCAGNCNANNNISGTLYVAGNEPFTYLALDTEDRTVYKIECTDSLKKELWKLQGKLVDLNYTEIKEFEKMKTAMVDGYSLKNADNKGE